MNNAKKLAVLGIALVVVVAIIVGIEMFTNRKPSGKALAFFPGIAESSISAIQITDKDNTVKLLRKGALWVVNPIKQRPAEDGIEMTAQAIPNNQPGDTAGATTVSSKEYPTDSMSIASLMKTLGSMKRDILVSKNPEKQETFEVDSAHGTTVEVWDDKGKSIGQIRIGKMGPDWNSNYVRTIGSNDVWIVGGNIKSDFEGDLKKWRNKTIAQFTTSTIKHISITVNDSATAKQSTVKVAQKTDSLNNVEWKVVEPIQSAANKSAIEALCNQLSLFACVEWEDDSSIVTNDSLMGFVSPPAVIAVEFLNGDKKSLSFGKVKPTSGMRYVKASDKPEIFLVYESKISEFSKTVKDLAAEDPQIPSEQAQQK